MEIFEILFPGMEAEVAGKLPLDGKTLTELQPIKMDWSIWWTISMGISVQYAIAAVGSDQFISCGVCQPTCNAGAVALGLRETVDPPPDLNRFLTARLGF